MPNEEGCLREPWLGEVLPLLALVVELVYPRLVTALRHPGEG